MEKIFENKHVSKLLDPKRFQVGKADQGEPRSYRDEWVDKFLNRINPDRKKAGYAALSHSRFGRMLKEAGKETGDLERLYNECAAATNFGALLMWKLKEDKMRIEKSS